MQPIPNTGKACWLPQTNIQKTKWPTRADDGVRLVAGTDAPTIAGLVPGFSLHQDLSALSAAGLTPYQVISTATRVPGEFIQKTKPNVGPFGTVSVGSRADLILSASNPLDDISALEKPLGVMAHGRWYSAAALRSLLDSVARKYASGAVN